MIIKLPKRLGEDLHLKRAEKEFIIASFLTNISAPSTREIRGLKSGRTLSFSEAGGMLSWSSSY